jgi:NADH:ubiquinone oxidoreductase subunit 5 (subunit L)/multisubunit Na+/H+ antiporter MnhA subunit
MPVTFIVALIFALSISGIPPLNGFASKWIIYQAIIDFGHQAGVANNLWILWLALAVIGSALTLASFIKFISGIFLGRKIPALANVRETKLLMLIPMIILALFCVGFGVFATNRVVPYLFTSITGSVEYTGIWNSTTVSFLVVVSIFLGFIIYLLGNIKQFRTEDSYIGGETNQDSTGFPVTNFYNTIRDSRFFSFFYRKAEKKRFDIYYLSKDGVLWLNNLLSKAHNGVLLNYAIWLVAGLIIMLFFLM